VKEYVKLWKREKEPVIMQLSERELSFYFIWSFIFS